MCGGCRRGRAGASRPSRSPGAARLGFFWFFWWKWRFLSYNPLYPICGIFTYSIQNTGNTPSEDSAESVCRRGIFTDSATFGDYTDSVLSRVHNRIFLVMRWGSERARTCAHIRKKSKSDFYKAITQVFFWESRNPNVRASMYVLTCISYGLRLRSTPLSACTNGNLPGRTPRSARRRTRRPRGTSPAPPSRPPCPGRQHPRGHPLAS